MRLLRLNNTFYWVKRKNQYQTILSLNFRPGLNEMEVLAEIVYSFPVLGFLPGRAFFFNKEKLPKPLNFTSSPFSKLFEISVKKELTKSRQSYYIYNGSRTWREVFPDEV